MLPSCGLLDQLSAKNGLKTAVFTNAGYGLQNRVVGGGVPFFQDLNPIPRMFSFSSFNSLNKGYLRLSQNSSTGNGGTCFGDSGGPNFLTVNGQQLIVRSQSPATLSVAQRTLFTGLTHSQRKAFWRT